MPLTYYDILGIPMEAGKSQIKSAFRQLALKYHPDKNPNNIGAQQKFIEISNAYQILSDNHRRARYDLSLKEGDLQAFQDYWDKVRPTKRPPPPPYYYTYAWEKIVYSGKTYLLGILAIVGIICLALLVPYFLLRLSSEQNYQKAVDLYFSRQYFSSLHHLDLAIKEFGDKNAEASTLAAIILTYRTKNYDYALKYINKGLAFNPDDSLRSELNYLKGVCLYRKKLLNEALRSFTDVGQYSPKKDSALFASGIIYTIHQDNPEKGADLFSLLLKDNPGFDKARYYHGFSRQKLEQHEEAIADFQQLIDRDYEVGASYYHKARSEIALERLDDACMDLRRAINYRVQEAEPLYQLYCVDPLLIHSNGQSVPYKTQAP